MSVATCYNRRHAAGSAIDQMQRPIGTGGGSYIEELIICGDLELANIMCDAEIDRLLRM